MKLLIDTHVVLWSLEDPTMLRDDYLRLIRSPRPPELIVSAASLWEIAIKVAKGKLRAPADLPDRLKRVGMHLLPVSAEHAWAVRHAPTAIANKDPFDRLIYTQAKLEGLPLATRDPVLLGSDLSVIHA